MKAQEKTWWELGQGSGYLDTDLEDSDEEDKQSTASAVDQKRDERRERHATRQQAIAALRVMRDGFTMQANGLSMLIQVII